jgi:hypothetical protein
MSNKTVKKRIYPNMFCLRKGHRVRFRNGGISKVRELVVSKSIDYPVAIKIKNFHAGEDCWHYNERGMIGEKTGPGHVCGFDIVEILK